jgi:hypothetical protein
MTGAMGGEAAGPVREVVVGCNSKVWRAAAENSAVAQRFSRAIGHRDVATFPFSRSDRVWVFSYSRVPEENSRLLAALRTATVREVVYVSSATTIVTRLTRCYGYPRVKQAAETEAREGLNARVLTLGIVVRHPEELPAGRNAATFQSWIEEFLLSPRWPEDAGTRMRLFQMVSVPFTRSWEVPLYRAYDWLQWRLRTWPCVLRPLDAMLRALGIRWYGYINLSNRLWTATTSSSARD